MDRLTEPHRYDASGMEHRPFDGRMPAEMHRTRRPSLTGHGRTCSSDPEIGCECGKAEYDSERAERATPGTVDVSFLAPGDVVRLMGGWVTVVSVDLLASGETRILHRTDFADGTVLIASQTLPRHYHAEMKP